MIVAFGKPLAKRGGVTSALIVDQERREFCATTAP